MKKLGQKGFSLVVGLLVIIALSLIVGVGFYVYNSTKKNDSQKTDTVSSNTNSASASQTASQKKYLKIPELGIKFELTDSIKDAYYYMHNDIPYLSVHYFDHLKGFEGCTATGSEGNGGGLAAIDRAKPGDDNFGSPWTEADLRARNGVKIGETYYWIEPNSQAPCWDFSTLSENDPDVIKVGTYKKAITDQQSTISKL